MWYQKDLSLIEKELETNKNTGLTFAEAQIRLKKYGPNNFPEKIPPSILVKFFSQFKSFLTLILIFATLASAILGDLIDSIAILAIVLLNATIGTYQEIKAEKTLNRLKAADISYTYVLRDGSLEKIPTEEVVVGDILVLEAGEKIPGDGRMIESYQLMVDESILTGESLPAQKIDTSIKGENIPLGDQYNMIFRDTKVVGGRGKAVVIATGSGTQMGKIALVLEETLDEKSPLTIELDRVGKMITFAVLLIAAIIFIITGMRQMPLIDRILIAISLSVAAIPEGLPAIATITLALGVERLANKKTIVKKLPSVETLGSIKIIATDKTGTLTENKMNVTDILSAGGKEFKVVGEGFHKNGIFYFREKAIDVEKEPELLSLLTSAILANDAVIKDEGDYYSILGDTTEGALLIAAERAGLSSDEVKTEYKRVFELPFSQERKMMSVAEEQDSIVTIFTKGAPEEIIRKSTLPADKKRFFLKQASGMAKQGLRTLAFAKRKLTKVEKTNLLDKKILHEEDFEFLGLIGEKDTLRLDIRESLERAKQAGIKTIMITGDHRETAVAIGLESGIIHDPKQAVTENEINSLSQSQIAKYVKNDTYRVFARVSPLGKLKIIEALKLIPQTEIAVTGDGVNDAPALKSAHVGIAMGSGTDITKEVADIIITDDNYGTIIEAIKEGRIIFANLIKFIRYLISCNLAEVFVVTLAVVSNTPLPLLPIHLLWINLITDGLPALALGNDPPETDVMLKPPKVRNQILHKRRWGFMLAEGIIMGVTVFILYLYALRMYDLRTAQTIAFSALAVTQLIHALNNRSTRQSIFTLGIFTNKLLILSLVASFLLQLLTVHTVLGQYIFKTSPLTLSNWLYIFGISLIPFIFVEIKKLGLRKLSI